MKPTALVAGVGMAVAFATVATGAARADVRVVQQTTVACPGLQGFLRLLPQQQGGSMFGMMMPMLQGKPWITTTYMRGSQMRTDTGTTSILVDTATKHQVTLNNQTDEYSLGPTAAVPSIAGGMSFHIMPSAQTGQMFGHSVRRYVISVTSSSLPMGKVSGELWAAPDLPAPGGMAVAGGPAADLASEMAKVKGLPLEYTLKYAGTPAGDINITSRATSLSEAPLPAQLFRVPAGYHRSRGQSVASASAASSPFQRIPGLDGSAASSLGISPGDMSDLSGMLSSLLGSMPTGSSSGIAGLGSALQGISPSMLNSLMTGLLGSSAGSAPTNPSTNDDIGSLITPQTLNDLGSALESLLSASQ